MIKRFGKRYYCKEIVFLCHRTYSVCISLALGQVVCAAAVSYTSARQPSISVLRHSWRCCQLKLIAYTLRCPWTWSMMLLDALSSLCDQSHFSRCDAFSQHHLSTNFVQNPWYSQKLLVRPHFRSIYHICLPPLSWAKTYFHRRLEEKQWPEVGRPSGWCWRLCFSRWWSTSALWNAPLLTSFWSLVHSNPWCW